MSIYSYISLFLLLLSHSQMETFSRDTTHILRKVGLEKLVAGHDHAHYAEDEVRMLTLYHFRLYETRPGLRQCLKHSGVAGRLWKAFVLNGYLGRNATFPTEEVYMCCIWWFLSVSVCLCLCLCLFVCLSLSLPPHPLFLPVKCNSPSFDRTPLSAC